MEFFGVFSLLYLKKGVEDLFELLGVVLVEVGSVPLKVYSEQSMRLLFELVLVGTEHPRIEQFVVKKRYVGLQTEELIAHVMQRSAVHLNAALGTLQEVVGRPKYDSD